MDVNETVLRVASGGENHIKISKVTNLVKVTNKAREKGINVAGAVVEGGADISKTKLSFPMLLVIGSEGKGIRPGLLKTLDAGLTIPMRGADLSFNAAIASALFCYEINRQRG